MSSRPVAAATGSASAAAPAPAIAVDRLRSLQALRGVAALMVAAMHLFTLAGGLRAAERPGFFLATRVLCSFGGAGVDLFFVISGCIISTIVHATPTDRGRIGAALRFLIRRVFRIYPLYWLAGAASLSTVLLVVPWQPAFEAKLSPSVLLLMTPHNTLLAPAWTLAFEIWFYAGSLVVLVAVPRRFVFRGFLLWGAAQAVLLLRLQLLADPARASPHPYMVHAPQVLEFFLGALAALGTHRLVLGGRWRVLCYLLSAGVFMAGSARAYAALPEESLDDWQRVLFYGVPAFLAVVGLLAAEKQKHLTVPRAFVVLGDVSYSIYLWHVPLSGLVFGVCVRWAIAPAALSPGMAMAELAVLLPLAWLSYRLIERPLIGLAIRLAP